MSKGLWLTVAALVVVTVVVIVAIRKERESKGEQQGSTDGDQSSPVPVTPPPPPVPVPPPPPPVPVPPPPSPSPQPKPPPDTKPETCTGPAGEPISSLNVFWDESSTPNPKAFAHIGDDKAQPAGLIVDATSRPQGCSSVTYRAAGWDKDSCECAGGRWVEYWGRAEAGPLDGDPEPTYVRGCELQPLRPDRKSRWSQADFDRIEGEFRRRFRTPVCKALRDASGALPPVQPAPAVPDDIFQCEVTEWSGWSQCSANCGGGTQRRTRLVVHRPFFGDRSCPALEETRACNAGACRSDTKYYLAHADYTDASRVMYGNTVDCADTARCTKVYLKTGFDTQYSQYCLCDASVPDETPKPAEPGATEQNYDHAFRKFDPNVGIETRTYIERTPNFQQGRLMDLAIPLRDGEKLQPFPVCRIDPNARYSFGASRAPLIAWEDQAKKRAVCG